MLLKSFTKIFVKVWKISFRFADVMIMIEQNTVSQEFVEAISQARGLDRSLVNTMLQYNVITVQQLADLAGMKHGTANQFTIGRGIGGIKLEKITLFPSLNGKGFKFVEVDSEVCRLLERELGI